MGRYQIISYGRDGHVILPSDDQWLGLKAAEEQFAREAAYYEGGLAVKKLELVYFSLEDDPRVCKFRIF